MLTLLLFAAGVVLLVAGADLLVRGSSGLAAAAGITPVVIGLTVVAFGTSAPELAVAIKGAFQGQADVAVGNVIGSNIFNVLFVLGLSAVIIPLIVDQQIVRLDVPILIGSSFLVYFLGLDGYLGRLDGAMLFSIAVGWIVMSIRNSRRDSAAIQAEYEAEFGEGETGGKKRSLPLLVVLLIVGLVMLVLGARWLLDSAVTFARLLGLSELIIGLTVVAVGTSLPEVATSIIAAFKGERDIAVGNAIGSNLMNILVVLGLTALVLGGQGIPVAPAALGFDMPIMIAVAVACLPIFFTDHLIARWEGALLFAYYLAYTLYLILDAADHDALPMYSSAMALFVLPLTAVTLVVLSWRAFNRQKRVTG